MTPLEINVLKTVISNLQISVKKNWETGDVHDWSRFAKILQEGIKNNIPILQALIDSSSTNDAVTGEPLTNKKLSL